jgi:hypothetical protein
MKKLRDAKKGRRIEAAIGDHGGGEKLARGMVKIRGGEFATPSGETLPDPII